MTTERILAVIAVALVVGAMLWGIFGHTRAYSCDATGQPDSHGSHICMKPKPKP